MVGWLRYVTKFLPRYSSVINFIKNFGTHCAHWWRTHVRDSGPRARGSNTWAGQHARVERGSRGQLRGRQEGEAGSGDGDSVGDGGGEAAFVSRPAVAVGVGWPHWVVERLRRGGARHRRGSVRTAAGWGEAPSPAVGEAGRRGPSSDAERGRGWPLRAVVGLLRWPAALWKHKATSTRGLNGRAQLNWQPRAP